MRSGHCETRSISELIGLWRSFPVASWSISPAQEKPKSAMNRLQILEAVLRPCARGSLGRRPDGHLNLARKRLAIAIRNNPYRGTGLAPSVAAMLAGSASHQMACAARGAFERRGCELTKRIRRAGWSSRALPVKASCEPASWRAAQG
jgi:hypothetical protein